MNGRKMAFSRFPMKDPRTVARDIPGIFDVIFPQLSPGTVAYFNNNSVSYDEIQVLPDELVKASALKPAMLFEIAFARGEQLLNGLTNADWDGCLKVATQRQRRHFDARIPDALTDPDLVVSEWVGKNLASMLNQLHANESGNELISSPEIPGYQWIASGKGDFSIGPKLIEVKCTERNFGSADYRQILMYWLLSYASAIEHDTPEWTSCILLNPRLNRIVEIPFNDIIRTSAAGRSKIEILELFSSMVGDYALKALSEFKL